MANDVFPGAALRQLKEWGFPQGSPRPTPPARKAFSVIHITGNSRLPSAESEVAWRINDAANQNSATFFVNRDGSIVQALGDPLHMDPWSNGDVNAPDRSNPRINAVVVDGVNANERTLVSIENVGFEPGNSITAAQEQACARIIAHYHAKAGVPVTRETVVGHYQLNSVSRPNCPGRNKALIDRIVAMAAGEDDVTNFEKLQACRETVRRKDERVANLRLRVETLQGQLATSDPAQLKAALEEIRAAADAALGEQ